MKFSVTVLPVLAALSSAAAVPAVPKQIDNEFDTLEVFPLLPLLNVMKTEEGLSYHGFSVNQVGLGGGLQILGIEPESEPNNIVTGVRETILDGILAHISINETETKHFDLNGFYYGCSVNTVEGAETLPQQCTFEVRGYDTLKESKAVVRRTMTYNPALLGLSAKPKHATFGNDFKGLKKISFTQLSSATGQTGNVLVLDNLEYTAYPV